MAAYCELHCRSAFSFLRGASTPEALVAEAAHRGLPALAVLDRDNLCAAPRVYGAARMAGVRARVGAEVTLADGSVLPLLVANRTGYRNLCRLISEAKLTPRPADVTTEAAAPAPGAHDPEEAVDPGAPKRPCLATWEELARHAEGLVALTGDAEGPIRRAWRRDGPAAAAAALARLEAIYGQDRLHVELQRDRRRGEDRELAGLRDLAATRGLPILATGGVDYATP
jgi:error-prone DNA polymerase